MKLKHVFWILSGIIGIIAMAAGIAVLVDRFITHKECPDGYIECYTGEDTEEEAE